MTYFSYKNKQLHAEAVALADIAAEFGTPCYVYSKAALVSAFNSFSAALKKREHLICYAVKANSNLAILNLFARLGSGFDIVSGGELKRVMAAHGDPRKVVFSGVGKKVEEMRAALEANIMCFNVESEGELLRLNEVAGKIGKKAPVSLRINPDVDPKTHPHIATGLKENKFGVDYADALAVYRKAQSLPHLEVTGIDCHIGSQLTEISPFIDSLEKILALLDKLEKSGIAISHIDIGGGLGIRYRDETPPTIAEYAAALFAKLGKRRQKVLIEPGRALVGHAGVLLTRVEYLKHNRGKNFAIVDAAMNDLQRPALYDAYHGILPVSQSSRPRRTYEIAGPVCESADFIGRGRKLGLAQGDLLAVMSAGAYGMSMSSNYNSRPRAAEVMVNDDQVMLIRSRETVDQLFSGEILLS